MEVLHRRCAGFDVHKKTVMVCVRILDERNRVSKEVRQFSTVTASLELLADWLASLGVTHVAMESTGVYWKPIYGVLEGRFELLLCNARHVKQVPGRKTDVKDCEWLAQLLQHGLLRPSFVPSRALRELRELTRQRAQLSGEQTRAINRIHKVLEGANIKLASVVTDVMGVSGRAIVRAMIAGETDARRLSELAVGRIRKKKQAELEVALQGRITDHHRFLLKTLLGQVEYLDQVIAELSQRITELMKSQSAPGDRPFGDRVQLLRTIPGIGERTAENIVAEIGCDMTIFPTPPHLASWAGVCPGNHESAGKQKKGERRKGSRWLRRSLAQAAWAAGRTKDTYLSAQYRRIARRRGEKRAIVAVAHTMLVIAHRMIAKGQPYGDLGPLHFDTVNTARLTRNLVRRLESLGHKVTIESAA